MTNIIYIIVVQLLGSILLFVTQRIATPKAFLSFTIFQNLLLMSTESVMPANHLILYYHVLLLPSIFPSIRVFSNKQANRITRSKCRHFSFSITLTSEYSVLISFRIDQFDLLVVQGTITRLLHNSKASILPCSSFFMVQCSQCT